MKTSVNYLMKNYLKISGQEVVIEGWIRANRAQKEFGFINLNDGSHFESIQIVYDTALENFKDVSKFRVGAALRVKGILVLTPQAKQPFEIKAQDVYLEGDSPEDYPIQPKRHSREFLREVAHLRTRTNLFNAVFRVRSLLAYAIHKFFQEREFIYVHTPIITDNDGEGAGQMFQVTTLDLEALAKSTPTEVDYSKDFFGKRVSLTVTGQLEGETFAQSFKKIYTFGPTFRAEHSNTVKHAAEFWMIEPEIAFADLEDNMNLAEEMVKYVVQFILENASTEMKFFDEFVYPGKIKQLQDLLKSKIVRCPYKDAIEIINKADYNFEKRPQFGDDLGSEHEKFLTDVYFKGPVFITNWPKHIKAFYMRVNDDNETVAAMDLLVPGAGELIGGSQREERLDVLINRMNELNIPIDNLQWYLDLRRYGSTKHAGFGLGFERLVMYVTGVENIRDVIPYPRTYRNCDF